MARGLEQHKARQEAIGLLGKDLARRARRVCELCEEKGELRPVDRAPDDEPSLETLVLLCSRCRELAGGAVHDPRTLHFLETAVWSEVAVVAALARELLAQVDAQWAREALSLL